MLTREVRQPTHPLLYAASVAVLAFLVAVLFASLLFSLTEVR